MHVPVQKVSPGASMQIQGLKIGGNARQYTPIVGTCMQVLLRYTTDVENIRETYAHYAAEDEDSLDDHGRTSTKPFHTLGRNPASATPATKDARKDKKGRGDHCQPQEQCEPTKRNQSEPGSSHTVNAGFSISRRSSLA